MYLYLRLGFEGKMMLKWFAICVLAFAVAKWSGNVQAEDELDDEDKLLLRDLEEVNEADNDKREMICETECSGSPNYQCIEECVEEKFVKRMEQADQKQEAAKGYRSTEEASDQTPSPGSPRSEFGFLNRRRNIGGSKVRPIKKPAFGDLTRRHDIGGSRVSPIKKPTFRDLTRRHDIGGRRVRPIKKPAFGDLTRRHDIGGSRVSPIKKPAFGDLTRRHDIGGSRVSPIKKPTFGDLTRRHDIGGSRVSPIKKPAFRDLTRRHDIGGSRVSPIKADIRRPNPTTRYLSK